MTNATFVTVEQTCTGYWYKLFLDESQLDDTFIQEEKGWAMYQPQSVNNEVEVYGPTFENCRVFVPAEFFTSDKGEKYVLVCGHMYDLTTRYEVGWDRDHLGRLRVYPVGWTFDGITDFLDFQPGINFDFLLEGE